MKRKEKRKTKNRKTEREEEGDVYKTSRACWVPATYLPFSLTSIKSFERQDGTDGDIIRDWCIWRNCWTVCRGSSLISAEIPEGRLDKGRIGRGLWRKVEEVERRFRFESELVLCIPLLSSEARRGRNEGRIGRDGIF